MGVDWMELWRCIYILKSLARPARAEQEGVPMAAGGGSLPADGLCLLEELGG